MTVSGLDVSTGRYIDAPPLTRRGGFLLASDPSLFLHHPPHMLLIQQKRSQSVCLLAQKTFYIPNPPTNTQEAGGTSRQGEEVQRLPMTYRLWRIDAAQEAAGQASLCIPDPYF